MSGWWRVPEAWAGETVWCIGGGSSLLGFPFERLTGRLVVGCNDAWKLGAALVPVCCFGDGAWPASQGPALRRYGGLLVTNCEECPAVPVPGFRRCRRLQDGLGTGDTLGWFYNTGALALNLALSLGAARVILLGYDMKCGVRKRRHNWYRETSDSVPGTYGRFASCFDSLAHQLPSVFPGREVLNAGPDSALTCFPAASLEDLLK